LKVIEGVRERERERERERGREREREKESKWLCYNTSDDIRFIRIGGMFLILEKGWQIEVQGVQKYCSQNYNSASWHSSATLTEVFPCFFLSCKAIARVKPAKMGHGQH
jgi:hypothetical protein